MRTAAHIRPPDSQHNQSNRLHQKLQDDANHHQCRNRIFQTQEANIIAIAPSANSDT